MEFSNTFYEDEIRDGFYIPAQIKQAWAAQLDVLMEIDKVCCKYNIPYFADWGTLLGAVRHGGFIPWDDDMDITMKRKDYNRFMEVAAKELPEGFEAYNYKQKENYWGFVARVVSKNRICFEVDHLERFHGFPYMAGVDIFILDYMSTDENKEKERVTVAKYILAVADGIAEETLSKNQGKEAIKKIEKLCNVHINENQSVNALRKQLYGMVENLFAMFDENDAEFLTRMMPDGLEGNKALRLPKKYYDSSIRLPFENTTIPVPIAYDEMLRRRYGDYMKLVRNIGGHDYPYYDAQKKDLERVMGSKMPEYTFDPKSLVRPEVQDENSLKRFARKYIKGSLNLLNEIKESISDAKKAMEIVAETQQYAIDMATLIEKCKGEGYVTVGYIEEYCECLYQLYEALNSGSEVVSAIKALEAAKTAVSDSITKDILERKEVVFLPYKAKYWNSLNSIYEEALKDPNCDVYVVLVPYYYKKYDKTLYDMQYEGKEFPQNVIITNYKEFDMALHCPDTIFIQNPYDEWHETITIPQEFYSQNLRKFTNRLVYIPYFKLYEFKKDSYREYYNMQFYCTVPGVVNADRVIVQSEQVKALYVEKLTEFAGETTRSIWEEKVEGIGTPLDDVIIAVDDEMIPKEWHSVIFKADGTRKMVIIFRMEISSFVQYGKRAIKKIKEVLDIFKERTEDIALIWNMNSLIIDGIRNIDKDLARLYIQVVEDYKKEDWGIYMEAEDYTLAVLGDGYYGDSGIIGQKVRANNKPIVIMDYETIE